MLTFMRKIAMIGLGGGLACGLVMLLSGWVIHFDDRLPSHSRMVGTLTVDLPQGRGQGTAVLVGECGILTAFHVAFGPWYVTAMREPSHEFVATFTLTEVTLPDGSHPSTRATPVVWGDYRGPDRQFRRPGDDWVYMVLDDCFGFKYGYVDIRPLEAEDLATGSLEFSTIGYSSGSQMRDPRCRIRADGSTARPGAWSHDCVLLPGDSGGPIFKRDTMTLVAIGSGAVAKPGEVVCSHAFFPGVQLRHEGKMECTNIAVPISPETADRLFKAHIAVGVQRQLLKLGYDAGPVGAVEGPKLKLAIEQAERSMGFPVTGEPTCGLETILWMQRKLN
jgi:Putative peptidoglycan binding domain